NARGRLLTIRGGSILHAGPGAPGRYNLTPGAHTAYGIGSPTPNTPQTWHRSRYYVIIPRQTHERIFQRHPRSCNLIGDLSRRIPRSVFERVRDLAMTRLPTLTSLSISSTPYYLVMEYSVNL
ncbi:uncharacterized protein N7518_008996, partial [Penicillium psychrosexuale]|uniref:uncharacterized protein n=1 Tax=Penicillium psychrosexuale TaxID=1002107 RepID=UPI002544EB6E